MAGNSEIKPWVLRKTVLPQNADHAGVMWHGSYLMWLEEARINALSKVGLAYSDLSNQGFEMPVVDLQIKYMRSLLHGEEVLLKSWIFQGKGPRWRWKTDFFNNSGEIAALANVDLVLIQRDNSGDRLLREGPEQLSKALRDLQRGPSKN
ncbi:MULTISPECIES: acyl-CoA thioesterase [Prochlorococcus]|uniref:Predicted thioesterase n=1 Tax=Prochlorococcus marinus (strain SARG / CCMP1375 / SS120) TaxID=167539 RepID=Q7VDL8_PROMA|nr:MULTISPECIES: acyl-CoA thioesterase [Prochlorococcus]AAP99404.1 Predicted thioesterase [Prochlorococcus marinus subsp. marinus str. CCMP1375]KGG11327.1 4-hydroxybenzoyl-CoA thioesterase family active site [Prochlorococcus marinus str. LG]KGG18717.1 4-hydroxybenzoyl-CoA thioesterase family active site [Prochlorococcus marinus str. SS2]KGG22991.1 4-hydroxybenzoyl-CoA thioesterase family active site [Prochlorococcus marinus str. SS35]KGG34095.1 4-hydroxybenzoyl-CoA thioesterase family active s